MRILVTNDDGIYAKGLWALVEGLMEIGEVVVVAPDQEQSAVGTAVSLRSGLRANPITPPVAGVRAYAVEGTPADCVIVGLEALFNNRIDLVIAGINQGANLGNDVLISGTVGAALQGYFRGIPSIALSLERAEEPQFSAAAGLAAAVARQIAARAFPKEILLNINLPSLPAEDLRGIEVTRLAKWSSVDKIEEQWDGERKYYRFTRAKPETSMDEGTDVWAVMNSRISITPLQTDLTSPEQLSVLEGLCLPLFEELRLRGV